MSKHIHKWKPLSSDAESSDICDCGAERTILGKIYEPIDRQVDEIHTAIDALLSKECFGFVDDILDSLSQRAWRTELDILLSYATATLPAKTKLRNRERFLLTCKHLHPEKDLWKGLF